MKDVPQPSPESYSPSDGARVYLAENDPDRHHHGTEGVIVEVLEDSLGEESGRELDSLSYRIKTDEGILDKWFRHSDLVPNENTSTG